MDSFLKKLAISLTLAAALVVASKAVATPIDISLNYSSTSGAAIQFDGASHFQFVNSTNNFKITSPGLANGLLGEMTGVFTIGTISTVGGISTAAVTGVGSLRIHDGHGFNLVSTLTWINIVQFGTVGSLNTAGSVNVSNITYGGTNLLLKELAMGPANATDVLSFSFAPAKSLLTLKTKAAKTAFSGMIQTSRVVPEGGTTLALFGIALAAVAFIRRRIS